MRRVTRDGLYRSGRPRDTRPGRIRVDRHGRAHVEKTLNDEDRNRRDRGRAAIRNIFLATGADRNH